jgi:hypothetical protein
MDNLVYMIVGMGFDYRGLFEGIVRQKVVAWRSRIVTAHRPLDALYFSRGAYLYEFSYIILRYRTSPVILGL